MNKIIVKNISAIVFLYAYVLIFAIINHISAFASNNHGDFIKKFSDVIASIEKYEVILTTKIYEQGVVDSNTASINQDSSDQFLLVKSTVIGESGKRMKIKTNTGSSELGIHNEHILVYDGTWLWVQHTIKQTKSDQVVNEKISAFKVDITKVSPDPINDPFNTVYGVVGTGLIRYKDFTGTFRELFEKYYFNEIIKNKDGELVYIGRLKEQLADNESICKIWLSLEDELIVAYSIGQTKDKPDMFTAIDYVSVNQPLSDDSFDFTPPAGVGVKDITNELLNMR